MKKTTILISLLIAFALILGACTAPAAEEAPAEEAPVEEAMEEEAAPAEEEVMEEETLEEAKGDFDETILADAEYDIALVVKNNTSPFWADHVEGAVAAGEDLGVNITTHAPEKQEDINLQIAILEDLITAEVDCVAIAPANTDGITAGIVKLNEAGIPVVYDNTMGPATEPYLTYVGIDNYEVGLEMGDYVANLMGEEGNVLILEGVQGQSTSDQRTQGAKDAFANYPGIVVESYATNWDATVSYDITTDQLTKLGGELDAVVAVGTGMAEAAAEAVLAYGGNLEEVVVGSFDITDAVIEGLERGNVDYTINQQPFWQAYYSVAACVQYLNGLEVPDRVRTPVAFVTLENLDQHR